jgi:hypothetical protein
VAALEVGFRGDEENPAREPQGDSLCERWIALWRPNAAPAMHSLRADVVRADAVGELEHVGYRPRA